MLPPVAQTRWMALAIAPAGTARSAYPPSARPCCVRTGPYIPGEGARLEVDAFGVRKLGKKLVHPLILDRIAAAHEGAHERADETGSASHGEAVGSGQVVNVKILHTDVVIFTCRHAKHHTRGMRGLCKETVRRIAEHHFQSKGHAAGSTAHAAGQVDEERMLFIDDDVQSVELRFSVGARPRCSRGRGSWNFRRPQNGSKGHLRPACGPRPRRCCNRTCTPPP